MCLDDFNGHIGGHINDMLIYIDISILTGVPENDLSCVLG